MAKEELLKQVLDTLANGNELKKVKVKFQNGDVVKYNFDTEVVENEVEVEDVEEEEEEEEEDEDEDDEDDEEDDDEDEEPVVDQVENKGFGYLQNTQVSLPEGRKINVINKP